MADAMIQVHHKKWCKQKNNNKQHQNDLVWIFRSFFVGLIGWWFNDNVMTVLLQALPLQQQPWQSRGGAPWRCLGRRISCASLWTRSRGFAALPSWDVSIFRWWINVYQYQCYKIRYENNLVFSVGNHMIWNFPWMNVACDSLTICHQIVFFLGSCTSHQPF